MHFPASTLLTSTDTSASVGKRQAGKGMHWAGRGYFCPSSLNCGASGQTAAHFWPVSAPADICNSVKYFLLSV